VVLAGVALSLVGVPGLEGAEQLQGADRYGPRAVSLCRVGGWSHCVAGPRAAHRLAGPPPLADSLLREVDFVGVESTHQLSVDERTQHGEIDLWHLLQVPIGSVLVVPLRSGHRNEPLSYGLPGGWQMTPQRLIWRFEGHANAKIGIAVASLTGRVAVLRQLGPDWWCLIVRQFPTDPAAHYADHPAAVPRNDQVFQAWDGAGFGEVEYHSPALNPQRGPRQLRDTNQLWAFGGSAQSIGALANALLATDISSLLAAHP
jgi:hypothetical protein